MNRTSILLFFMLINAASVFAIDLPIGTSSAELAIKTEADVGEYYGKGLPLGPAALRFVGENLWVSDSLNKRLVEFDAQGKQLKSVAIATESHVYPEDFVILPDGDFWVCDVDNAALLKIDAAGKILEKLTEIGGKKLAWPARIELLPSGNLLVLDYTLGELIEFSADAKLVMANAVHGRSFLVDTDSVCYLTEKNAVIKLVTRTLANGKESSVTLPLTDVLDTEILAHPAANEFVIGFKPIPKEDDQASGLYMLMRIADGKTVATMQAGFPQPFFTRLLISDDQKKHFMVRLAQTSANWVLRLEPIALDFSFEKSGG
ncbi:MAG: hypothetical protein KKB51_00970 [Candidatus Riflebacteria bacterium]|nr:hypothetical protein [Candidatus Riflebacteria bacterium]